MALKESLRTRISHGEIVFGLFYKLNSPAVIEMMGYAGMDFLVVDREHSPIDHALTEDIIRCAELAGVPAVVRVPVASEEHIFHALDSGAAGVQIPNITTADECRTVVRAAKYAPDGCRGLSRQTRAGCYGMWDNAKGSYVEKANEDSLVVVHIENKQMADAIEEICQIPQVDVVFVGPADMSQSLGIPGKERDPQVVEIAKRVLETASRYRKAGGINITNIDDLPMYIEAGARYIMCNSDISIVAKALKGLSAQLQPYKNFT